MNDKGSLIKRRRIGFKCELKLEKLKVFAVGSYAVGNIKLRLPYPQGYPSSLALQHQLFVSSPACLVPLPHLTSIKFPFFNQSNTFH